MTNTTYKPYSATDPPKAQSKTTRWVFTGAVCGLFAGLVTMLVATTANGAMSGLAPLECAVYGTTMTVLLSQPAGLAGLLAGAVCGGICALVARHVHQQ